MPCTEHRYCLSQSIVANVWKISWHLFQILDHTLYSPDVLWSTHFELSKLSPYFTPGASSLFCTLNRIIEHVTLLLNQVCPPCTMCISVFIDMFGSCAQTKNKNETTVQCLSKLNLVKSGIHLIKASLYFLPKWIAVRKNLKRKKWKVKEPPSCSSKLFS